MTIAIKPGMRLFGAACATELVVIKAPSEAIDLRIGGHPALTDAAERDDSLSVTTSDGDKPAMSKRYVNADESLEVLCTKAGEGAPAVGDTLLTVKASKPLPASD